MTNSYSFLIEHYISEPEETITVKCEGDTMEVTLVEKGRHKFKYLKTKSEGKMNNFFHSLILFEPNWCKKFKGWRRIERRGRVQEMRYVDPDFFISLAFCFLRISSCYPNITNSNTHDK